MNKVIKEYFIAFLKVIGVIIMILYACWAFVYVLVAPDVPLWGHIATISSVIIFATIAVKKGY